MKSRAQAVVQEKHRSNCPSLILTHDGLKKDIV